MSAADLASLNELQNQITAFLQTLRHPVVSEDNEELFDLTAARWKLSVEFGKLLFEAWNDARSIGRRVEEIAYRDGSRMGVFVRKPGTHGTSTLEFSDLEPASRGAARKASDAPRPQGRGRARRELLTLLEREYPGWKFERISNRSDREHSFSAWYTRGIARQGRTAWAFLGLAEDEPPAAADAILAHGLIWLDWTRGRSERVSVAGLKLFLPSYAVELTAHRATCLNSRALQIEIFDWNASAGRATAVDLKDFGNVATQLTHRRQAEMLAARHREFVVKLLGEAAGQVDVAADASASFLSLRARGLEIARVEGQITPRAYFGIEGNMRALDEDSRDAFRSYLNQVLELRRAEGKDTRHDYYRLQSERWLESVLLRDVSRGDPELSSEFVYQQIPAFAGGDRGVIDLLGLARDGRLAVIELKLTEEINLPMQGLDYWLRVKWLAERGAFPERGYFWGREISPLPPRLYLVCPAFRFHSSTDLMFRYLDPAIDIIQVGLNQQWREKVQVLFRRPRSGGT